MSGVRTYLSIGDVLTLLREEFPDVTISKIRFLESQRLINPERSPSGYRKFYEADVERLRWVLRQQRDHFLPLKVIRDRLAAAGNGVPTDEPNGDAQGEHVDAGRPTVATRVAASLAAARLAAEGVGNGTTVQVAEPPSAEGFGTGPVAAGPAGAASPGRSSPGDSDNGPGASAGRARPGGVSTPGVSTPASTPASAPALEPEPEPGPEPEPEPEPAMGQVASATDAAGPVVAGEPPDRVDAAGGEPDVGQDRGSVPEPVDEPPARAHATPAPPVSSQGHAPAHAAPVTPAEDLVVPGGEVGSGEHPLGRGPSLTLDELCAASGLAAPEIAALENFGLIEATSVAGATYYDDEAVSVAKLAAKLAHYGLEARHLRLYRNAVEREVGLVEQVVAPLLRQRNPAARQRAVDSATDMARLGEELHGVLLRRELRRQLGG